MRGFIAVAFAAIASGAVFLFAAGGAAPPPELSAKLLDAEHNALKKEAAVEVSVKNLKLVDPEEAGEKPKSGEGHVHYQIDAGPVVATTATKLSFHEMPPGKHEIKVTLSANDSLPLGPAKILKVSIP